MTAANGSPLDMWIGGILVAVGLFVAIVLAGAFVIWALFPSKREAPACEDCGRRPARRYELDWGMALCDHCVADREAQRDCHHEWLTPSGDTDEMICRKCGAYRRNPS